MTVSTCGLAEHGLLTTRLMEFLDIMKAIWPMLVVFVTVVIVLAKMHGDIEIIKEKIKTLFSLWNSRDKK